MNDEWARGEDGIKAVKLAGCVCRRRAGKIEADVGVFFFFLNRRRPRRLHLPAVFMSPSAGISHSAGNTYCAEHLTETLCIKRQDAVG